MIDGLFLFNAILILFLIDHLSILKIQITLANEEEFDECCTNGKLIGKL